LANLTGFYNFNICLIDYPDFQELCTQKIQKPLLIEYKKLSDTVKDNH